MSELHVKGLSELQKFLTELPVKMEANIMRGAMRAGIKPIRAEAKALLASNGSVDTAQLQKGLKVSARSRGGKVSASLRVTGKHGHVAYWLEYTGAAPHLITGKNRKGLSFGGMFFQSVNHPGFKARPFMRPALDAQAQNAVLAVGNYIKNRLTKQGLDMADIMVEGDE